MLQYRIYNIYCYNAHTFNPYFRLQNYAGFTCSTETGAKRTVNISMFAGSEYSYDFYAYKLHFKVLFNTADNI
jgi:hypothetical protein